MVYLVKYATIDKNDMVNGEGVSVSLWMQGCPHRCKGCHNPELWNFNGGQEKPIMTIIEEIASALVENGIQRNLSILGGEPLCPENFEYTLYIIDWIKATFPNIKIFVWTGYELKELKQLYNIDKIKNIDVLITGRYIQELRDVTLQWRGSSNQQILYKGIHF